MIPNLLASLLLASFMQSGWRQSKALSRPYLVLDGSGNSLRNSHGSVNSVYEPFKQNFFTSLRTDGIKQFDLGKSGNHSEGFAEYLAPPRLRHHCTSNASSPRNQVCSVQLLCHEHGIRSLQCPSMCFDRGKAFFPLGFVNNKRREATDLFVPGIIYVHEEHFLRSNPLVGLNYTRRAGPCPINGAGAGETRFTGSALIFG